MNKVLVFFATIIFCFSTKVGLADDMLTSRFVKATISLEDPNIQYDSRYRKISYPSGDVPSDVGVCSDVVIRAYRLIDIDLQKLVHEDMKKHFHVYPKIWGLSNPDTNIDHRRVPNLITFFIRHGTTLDITSKSDNYLPGDIVTWNLRDQGNLPHIGIVTNQYSPHNKNPLIMHNIGYGQVLEDILFEYHVTGHYRYGLE